MTINEQAKKDLHYADQITGIDFEKYMVKILNQIGYHNVTRTPDSNDGGLDAYGTTEDHESIGWQFKNYKKHNVPFHSVEEAISGSRIYGTKINVVLTNGYFSNQTIEKAQDINMQDPHHPVKLVNRNQLLDLFKEYETKVSDNIAEVNYRRHNVDQTLQNPFVQKIIHILHTANFKNIHRTQKSALHHVDIDCYSSSDLRFGIVFLLTDQPQNVIPVKRVTRVVQNLYTNPRPFTHVLLITNGKYSSASVEYILRYDHYLTITNDYPTYYIQTYDHDSLDQLKNPQENETSDSFNSVYYQSVTSKVASIASASDDDVSSNTSSDSHLQAPQSQSVDSDSSQSNLGDINSSDNALALNENDSSVAGQDSEINTGVLHQLSHSLANSLVSQSESGLYSSATRRLYQRASFCADVCKLAFKSMSSSANTVLDGQLTSISAYQSTIDSQIAEQNYTYSSASVKTSAAITSAFDSQSDSLSKYQESQRSLNSSLRSSTSDSLSEVIAKQNSANQSSFDSAFQSASSVYDDKFESTYQIIQSSLSSIQVSQHQNNLQLDSMSSSVSDNSQSLIDHFRNSLSSFRQSISESNSYQQSLSKSDQDAISQSTSYGIESLQDQVQTTAASVSSEVSSFVDKFSISSKKFHPFITKMSNNIFLMDSLLKSLDTSVRDQFSISDSNNPTGSGSNANSKYKICPYCGQRCSKSDRFCKNCGRLIERG